MIMAGRAIRTRAYKASAAAPCFNKNRLVDRVFQLSEAETYSDRGIDVVVLKKAIGESTCHLRKHHSYVGIPLGRKLPIDKSGDRV